MTCSGGDSAQGADEAHRLGLELPALAPQTCVRLAELLPAAATVANPLDYTAMIWGDVAALGELVRGSARTRRSDRCWSSTTSHTGLLARPRSPGARYARG